MKFDITFTITFDASGLDSCEDAHDIEAWTRGFKGSVDEFCADLKEFFEKQPIVQSVKMK